LFNGEQYILKHVVLAGSWCTLFYEKYFAGTKYAATLKTRDIDFLIPRPLPSFEFLVFSLELAEQGI